MRADTALDTLLRHLDHCIGILGEDGLGLGSDFDGATVPDAIGDAAGLTTLRGAMQRPRLRRRADGEALPRQLAARARAHLARPLERDAGRRVRARRRRRLGRAPPPAPERGCTSVAPRADPRARPHTNSPTGPPTDPNVHPRSPTMHRPDDPSRRRAHAAFADTPIGAPSGRLAGAALAVAIGLASVAGLALSSPPALAETPPNMLVVANQIDDITTIDPAQSFEFSGSDVIRNVYQKLVDFDPNDLDAGFQPSLAERAGRRPRTARRSRSRWPRGRPSRRATRVTAEDAEFSLRRAVTLAKTPSFILTQFGFTPENVEQTIVADGNTLTLTLDKAVRHLVRAELPRGGDRLRRRQEDGAREREGRRSRPTSGSRRTRPVPAPTSWSPGSLRSRSR